MCVEYVYAQIIKNKGLRVKNTHVILSKVHQHQLLFFGSKATLNFLLGSKVTLSIR